MTYTVTMKQGAKFHDGSPITADDVVFSMERILAMKQGAHWLFKGVIDPGRTKAVDAHTVQFTLNQPYAGAPKDLKGYSYDLAKAKDYLAMVKAPMRQLEIGVLAGFDHSEAAAHGRQPRGAILCC